VPLQEKRAKTSLKFVSVGLILDIKERDVCSVSLLWCHALSALGKYSIKTAEIV